MSAQPDLAQIQAAFYAAVVDPAQEDSLLPLLVETPAIARQRLLAYRRSVYGNLIAALEATYPVLVAIVGTPFFRQTARAFIQVQPSLSGDLNDYGAPLADFLESDGAAGELPYLPDVARLEWLVQQVFYAADDDPPDLSSLAEVAPADYGRLCFKMAGAHARLASRWPLGRIWQVNQPDFAPQQPDAMAVDFNCAEQVLVWRQQGWVRVEVLTPGAAALFDALAAGLPLADATDAALRQAPDFDPSASLAQWAGKGLLLGCRLQG